MKRISQFITAIAIVVGLAMVFVPVSVGAVDVISDSCAVSPDSAICKGKDDDTRNMIKTVINTLLYIIGIVAVIMVVIGGFMYTLSTGDSANVTKAKNTIVYALVGLVVAFLAYAIVNWVLKVFG